MCIRDREPVDTARAAELVFGQFPWLRGAAVEPFAEGWDNTVFVVNGEWAFRFPRRQVAIAGGGAGDRAASPPGSPAAAGRAGARAGGSAGEWLPLAVLRRPAAARPRARRRRAARCGPDASGRRARCVPAPCTPRRWRLGSAPGCRWTRCAERHRRDGHRWPASGWPGSSNAAPGPTTAASRSSSRTGRG